MHAHDHGHNHQPGGVNAHPGGFGIGAVLNTIFVILEVFFGIIAGSSALIADAVHNFSDIIGLVLAWLAFRLAKLPPFGRRTFGLGRTTIMAALFSGVLLLVSALVVAWEAIGRLLHPQPVSGEVVLIVALVGVLINGLTVVFLRRQGRAELNVRVAVAHMLADAVLSLGVAASGLVIMLTGWRIVDPLMSLVIVGVVVWGTWGLLVRAVDLSVDAVPEGIELEEVRSRLSQLPGVTAVHDLHVWPLSTTRVAATAHLVVSTEPQGERAILLDQARKMLGKEFSIEHVALQLELQSTSCPSCSLKTNTSTRHAPTAH